MWCLVLAAVVLAAPSRDLAPSGSAPCGAAERAEPGAPRCLTTPDGRERSWLEHTPNDKGRPQRPLIVALHGGGGSAEQFREHSTLDDVGDALGAVVVHANGTAGPGRIGSPFLRWDAGPCCVDSAETPVDDVGFLVALVRDVGHRHRIDPERVVLVGHSNGAMMAERALCARPDVFSGAVLVGSPGIGTTCETRPARPVVVVHGRQDRCATYQPSASCGGCWEAALERALGRPVPQRRTLVCDGARAIAGGWGALDGPPTVWTAGGASCERWGTVSLCSFTGGHVFPSGNPPCTGATRLCTALLETVGPVPSPPVAMEAVLREVL